MTNEELIIQRLDRLETLLKPMSESTRAVLELRDDLLPRMNEAAKALVLDLQDVELAFSLDDLWGLFKRFLRSIKNLSFALNQLENIVDFVNTIEPMLKSSVPQMVKYLDDLEQRGVFRTYTAMLNVRSKVAAKYGPEDFEQLGDAFVSVLGLLKKLGQPETISFLERLMSLPSDLDLAKVEGVGPWGLLSAASKPEVKQGLGVIIELTKALGKIK